MFGVASCCCRTSGDFDVETDLPWTDLWWAEGYEFRQQAYADGALVPTIPNEIRALDWFSDTDGRRARYRKNVGKFGSRPGIQTDGNDLYRIATPPGLTQPFTIVAVAAYDAATLGETLLSLDSSDNIPTIGELLSGITFSCGTGLAAGVPSAQGFLANCYGGGAAGFIEINGIRTSSNVGLQNPQNQQTLFANFNGSTPWRGHLALLGYLQGRANDQENWAAFEQWVNRHYGFVIP